MHVSFFNVAGALVLSAGLFSGGAPIRASPIDWGDPGPPASYGGVSCLQRSVDQLPTSLSDADLLALWTSSDQLLTAPSPSDCCATADPFAMFWGVPSPPDTAPHDLAIVIVTVTRAEVAFRPSGTIESVVAPAMHLDTRLALRPENDR